MVTKMKPLVEINQQAIALLYQKLGVIDTVRFLKQFKEGYGNYTKEREDLFGRKSLDEIMSEIETMRNNE
ncbi:hypothetical protein GF373_07725 [bacterium]|nr:hypothetical protein [bacterium]